MKSLSPIFLTQNAATLQWSFALLVLDLIVGSFFANQGYWELESRAAIVFFNILSAYLYLCVFYRILRPNGSEHAQVMMFLLLMPKTDIALNFLLQQILVAIIVLLPFLNRYQIYSLVMIALTALPAAGMWAIMPIQTRWFTSSLYSPTATTEGGKLISSTDKLYKLYRFENYGDPPRTYRLLRILPVCPGLSLIKQIGEMTTAAPVQVSRSKTGKYSIEEVSTVTSIEQEKKKP